jgi:hypothetical protein
MDESVDELALGHFRGTLDSLLEAIERAQFDDAILELDSWSAPEVREFALSRTGDRDDLVQLNEAAGGRRLGPFLALGDGSVFLPIEGDNVAMLRELARKLPSQLVALHVHVHRRDHCLLSAFDVGDNEIRVSATVSERQLETIRATLGAGLRPE